MGRTVLYIDDAPQLPARTRAVLTSVDFALVHPGDPAQALRWVHDEPPALVLIEVLLDACDGFELIEQIASTPAGGEVPVVIVTRGERSPELYGRALEFPADARGFPVDLRQDFADHSVGSGEGEVCGEASSSCEGSRMM